MPCLMRMPMSVAVKLFPMDQLSRGVCAVIPSPYRSPMIRPFHVTTPWKRDAPLVTKKLGRAPHAVGERDVHGLTSTIDDRLAQLRALGVGCREVAHILGGE